MLIGRPASLQLAGFDSRLLSSTTDGSAFILSYEDNGNISLRGYMSSSFGARQDGHDLDTRLSPECDIAVFAPASAMRMILVHLDTADNQLKWMRLILTKENSELQLRPVGPIKTKKETSRSVTNPLLGVFEDMWTTLPVAAAIKRDNLDKSTRQPRSVTLIEPSPGALTEAGFSSLWRQMVSVSLALTL